MESWQLSEFDTVEEAIAYRRLLKDLSDFDGIYLKDIDHAIVFSGNQVKSGEFMTGDFSRNNDDIRRSVRATTQADPRNLPNTGRELAQQYFQQKRPGGWVRKRLPGLPLR